MGQVLTLEQLRVQLPQDRLTTPVVFTNGCFDILHVGHSRYLKDAKALGKILVVGVNSDASVRRLKGSERPIQTQDDRAELVASLGAVDYVVLFEEDTPIKLIEGLRPQVLVKGGDWAIEKIEGSTFVRSYGGEVKSLPFHTGRSTTALIQRIDQR
jgi:D-glycero-beta-D-manno-heptose 1-phosphate adenylyltransferase